MSYNQTFKSKSFTLAPATPTFLVALNPNRRLLLLAVNGTPATGVDQIRALAAKSGKSVALLIQRGEDKIFVPVRIG